MRRSNLLLYRTGMYSFSFRWWSCPTKAILELTQRMHTLNIKTFRFLQGHPGLVLCHVSHGPKQTERFNFAVQWFFSTSPVFLEKCQSYTIFSSLFSFQLNLNGELDNRNLKLKNKHKLLIERGWEGTHVGKYLGKLITCFPSSFPSSRIYLSYTERNVFSLSPTSTFSRFLWNSILRYT